MPQFLIGFWCGCVAATLVLGLLYTNRRKPLSECDETVDGGASADNEAGTATGPRILLVDDSRLSRTVMKEYLAKRNLQVFEARSGAESIKLTKKHCFDVIFIDQCMPGMDGDETLERLWKEGGVERTVPVVAVGSAVRKNNEPEFRERGYAACLGKPIQENRLEEILSQILPEEENFREVLQEAESLTEVLPEGILQEPDGFSYENGVANFDGNESVYRETLVLFADLWAERKEQLGQFLADGDMPEYAILIHAIKGDARTLGAEGFGSLAYEQELQAKAGDAEAIKNTFERVIRVGDETAEYFKQMYS